MSARDVVAADRPADRPDAASCERAATLQRMRAEALREAVATRKACDRVSAAIAGLLARAGEGAK